MCRKYISYDEAVVEVAALSGWSNFISWLPTRIATVAESTLISALIAEAFYKMLAKPVWLSLLRSISTAKIPPQFMDWAIAGSTIFET